MRAIFLFILFILCVFLLYPIYFLIEKSFLVDGSFSFYFVVHAFIDKENVELLLRSINLALLSTLFSTLISFPLSFLSGAFSFRAKGFLQLLVLFPLILPPFVGAVGLKQMLARFGPVNLILLKLGILDSPIDFLGEGGYIAVAITQALHLFPIMYLNLSAALASRDPALEEAARCVGAPFSKILSRIILPMLLPGFFAGASIVFIWSFTDIGTPLVFRVERLLPVVIFNLRDQIHDNPAGYALALVTLVVSIVIFIFGKLISSSKISSSAKGSARNTLRPLRAKEAFIVGFPVLSCLALALLPHIGVLLLSFSDKWFMSILPQSYTLSSYALVFSHSITLTSMRNSLFLSFSSTILDIFLGIAIAWLVQRTLIKGRKALDVLCMLPLAVPGVILAFSYLGAFSGTILNPRVNPFPLLIIGYALRRLPFMLRAVSAGLEQANKSLEEAAFSVGASKWQCFRSITLPLLFPHIAAGAILSFAFEMLEVSESLLLAMEERYFPVSKAMYVLIGRPDGLQLASALGILGMLLIAASLYIAAKALGKDIAEVFRL